MCEMSGKLIAWLDGELPPAEASEVAQHLETCPSCRNEVDRFNRVSTELSEYCDEAVSSTTAGSKAATWLPVAAAFTVGAALVALFLAMPRTKIESPTIQPAKAFAAALSSPVAVSGSVHEPEIPVRKIHERQAIAGPPVGKRTVAPVEGENAYLTPGEPTVQIAIPAVEIFPPGAVPEGMNFVADVTISADGSAERISLRPRLVGYERGTTQP